MKDPNRISDGDDFRANLLRVAKGDRVPTRAKARTVAVIVAGGAAVAGRGALASGTRSIITKVLLVAVVGAGGVALYDHFHRDVVIAPPSALPTVALSAPPPSIVEEPTPPTITLDDLPTVAPVAKPMVSTAPSSRPVRLADEIAALDRVRGSLRSGDAAGALGTLAAYHHDFPAAQLSREATLLEIEALEKSGQHDRATTLARAFIRANPESPARKQLGAYE